MTRDWLVAAVSPECTLSPHHRVVTSAVHHLTRQCLFRQRARWHAHARIADLRLMTPYLATTLRTRLDHGVAHGISRSIWMIDETVQPNQNAFAQHAT